MEYKNWKYLGVSYSDYSLYNRAAVAWSYVASKGDGFAESYDGYCDGLTSTKGKMLRIEKRNNH